MNIVARPYLDSAANFRRPNPDKIPQFGQQTPMKRAGQPAELAPVYVYLASGESSYVTAEVHGVCGGEHLG